MRPEQYLGASLEALAQERSDLIGRLFDVHMDLGDARAKEIIDKAQAWRSSGESTTSGRESYARNTAYAVAATVRELEGQRDALTMCLAYLVDLIEQKAAEELQKELIGG